ncbi:hypothetical protein [Pleionea sediminis]|uniref:hypothetical protein n=1 Tax=Pleionea sediminis TaxID=2569479 RepID=UPI0011863C0B|nr:hypothetical protein [Pleionea sediminis]
MSEITLKQLRNTLERNHWKILDELPGDDYKYSGFWKIARPDNSSSLTIAFNGLDDMQTYPMEKAYGFELVEDSSVSAYMGKHTTKSWPEELQKFIEQLNEFKT